VEEDPADCVLDEYGLADKAIATMLTESGHSGTTIGDRQRILSLEREVHELRRTSEILKGSRRLGELQPSHDPKELGAARSEGKRSTTRWCTNWRCVTSVSFRNFRWAGL
jgi:hypothetical protein